MKQRKLQPFYNDNLALYVIESHVKQIMRMATDGEFTEMKINPVVEENQWYVVFSYKTNYSKGIIKLRAQEIKEVK